MNWLIHMVWSYGHTRIDIFIPFIDRSFGSRVWYLGWKFISSSHVFHSFLDFQSQQMPDFLFLCTCTLRWFLASLIHLSVPYMCNVNKAIGVKYFQRIFSSTVLFLWMIHLSICLIITRELKKNKNSSHLTIKSVSV